MASWISARISSMSLQASNPNALVTFSHNGLLGNRAAININSRAPARLYASTFPSLVQQFWRESSKLSSVHPMGDTRELRVVRVFDEIRRISVPPADVYNRVIEVCSKSQHLSRTETLFGEMKQLGISPDLATYKSLIIMYGQRKQIEKVQLLLNEIHSSGMEPNDDLRNELMIVFAENNKIDLALAEYTKLREASHKPIATNTLDVLLHTMFLKGVCDKAIEIFTESKQLCVPTPRMNNIALKLFCRRYRRKEAVQLFWEMKQIQTVPVATHNDLISLLAKHNMLKELEEIFADMKARGPRPDIITYTEVLNFYAFRRAYEKVVELLHELVASGLCGQSEAYRIALEVMVRDPQARPHAFDLVFEMRAKGIPVSAPHLCELIANFSAGGREDDPQRLARLLEFVRERGTSGEKSDTSLYVAVINAFVKMKAMREARTQFEEAIKIFGNRIELFNAILSAYAKDLNYSDALEVLDRIPREGVEPNAETYATCLRLVDDYVHKQRKNLRAPAVSAIIPPSVRQQQQQQQAVPRETFSSSSYSSAYQKHYRPTLNHRMATASQAAASSFSSTSSSSSSSSPKTTTQKGT